MRSVTIKFSLRGFRFEAGIINKAAPGSWRRSAMVIVEDQHHHVVNCAGERPAMSSRSAAEARRQWVAPTWERRDTPMEVTMYAGQR